MIQFDTNLKTKRWIAYFDLLGIRKRLTDARAQGHEERVFTAYKAAVERCVQIKSWVQSNPLLRPSWFSDSFLLVGNDDSVECFEQLDRMARNLSYFLIQARIPFRGAIACDFLYADFDNNILFGTALVEAHQFGEWQDWIGLVFAPSAAKRMEILGSSYHELHYELWNVAWKSKNHKAQAITHHQLLAYRLGTEVNNSESCIRKLREMLQEVTPSDDDGRVQAKYSRTLEFLAACHHPWKG